MPEDRPSDRKPPADGTVPLTPPGVMRGRGNQDRLHGQLVDHRFRIRGVLGEGGMGRVYLAEDEKLNRRRVALKLMGASLTTDPEFRARFHREAVLQANLPHPQIVQVLDIGESEEGAYIAMEYSDGRALSTLIKELGPRPLEKALDITAQILEILDFAHRQGVVHRDLKPSNILIEERAGREFVRVLDFGIAKLISRDGSEFGATLTKAGHAYGTLGYMAPEQAKGESEKLDHRADVYSVGIILREMLTGQVPAPPEARTHPVRYAMWVTSNPVKPLRETHPELDIAEEVDNIIRSALRREPEKRYSSALAFLQAIREFRRHSEASTVRGASARKGFGTESLTAAERGSGGGRSSAVAWIAAAVCLAAAGGLGWMWKQANSEAAELRNDVQKASDLLGEQGVKAPTLAEGVLALAKRTPGDPAAHTGLQGTITELREKLERSEAKVRELGTRAASPAEWETEKARLESDLKAAGTKAETAEAKVALAEAAARTATGEVSRIAKELEEAGKTLAAKESEITALKAAPTSGGETAARLKTVESERERLAAEVRVKDEELARQKTKIEALEKGGGDASKALRDEVAAARTRAEDLERRTKALESDLVAEKTRAKEAEDRRKTAEQNELTLRREAEQARNAAESGQTKLAEANRNLEAERIETARLKGVVEAKDRELATARSQPTAGANVEEMQRVTRERDSARSDLATERQRADFYAQSLRAAGIDPNTGRPYSSGGNTGGGNTAGGGTVVNPPPPPPPLTTSATLVCDVDIPGGSIRLEKIVVRPSGGASYEVERSRLPNGTMVIGEKFNVPLQGSAEIQVTYQRYNSKSSREGMRTTDWIRVGPQPIPLR